MLQDIFSINWSLRGLKILVSKKKGKIELKQALFKIFEEGKYLMFTRNNQPYFLLLILVLIPNIIIIKKNCQDSLKFSIFSILKK